MQIAAATCLNASHAKVDFICPTEIVLETVPEVPGQSMVFARAPVGFSWTEHVLPIVPQALPESQTNAGDASRHVSNAQAQPIFVLIVWIPSLCLETLENANRAPPAITFKPKSKAESVKEFVDQDFSLTTVCAYLEDVPMDSKKMD